MAKKRSGAKAPARAVGSARTIIITGVGPLDETFSNEHGTWNVTRAQRDCDAGKHRLYRFNTQQAYEANCTVEIDEVKIERFMRSPRVIAKPLILVIEGGKAWLIEGHHRLRALHRLGVPEFAGYVIEEADEPNYRVLKNGQRWPLGEL